MLTPDPKTMARALRAGLAQRDLAISHSTALELVALQFGHSDWNGLAARLYADGSGADRSPDLSKPLSQVVKGAVLPAGWFVSGRSDLFEGGLLVNGDPHGRAALTIESRAPHDPAAHTADAGEFLTIMQRISAAEYLGKTVSFRAWISCADATGTGRIWIHARNGRQTLAFDNLGLDISASGPVTSTTDWCDRHVTIEVPSDAAYIGFGVLFGSGIGRFKASGLSFGVAAADERPRALPTQPRNLDLDPA